MQNDRRPSLGHITKLEFVVNNYEYKCKEKRKSWLNIKISGK